MRSTSNPHRAGRSRQSTPCSSIAAPSRRRSMPGASRTDAPRSAGRLPVAVAWPGRGHSRLHYPREGRDLGSQGAFYEFQWPAVLHALGEARRRRVDVRIVFDDIESGSPTRRTRSAIQAAPDQRNLHPPRRRGSSCTTSSWCCYVEQAEALLFGSTNLTENGIFGHVNCVHIVEDAVAAGVPRLLRGTPPRSADRPGAREHQGRLDCRPQPAPVAGALTGPVARVLAALRPRRPRLVRPKMAADGARWACS